MTIYRARSRPPAPRKASPRRATLPSLTAAGAPRDLATRYLQTRYLARLAREAGNLPEAARRGLQAALLAAGLGEEIAAARLARETPPITTLAASLLPGVLGPKPEPTIDLGQTSRGRVQAMTSGLFGPPRPKGRR